MGPETIVTLIGVALIVGALAAYLIIIAYSLYKVSFTLGTVLIGVRAIAARCEPLREVLGSIGNDVAAVEQAMARLGGGRGAAGADEEDESEVAEWYEEPEEPEEEVRRPRRRARVRR